MLVRHSLTVDRIYANACVDVEAATKLGIIVVNSPSGNIGAAAEHTIALLLAVARNIPDGCSSLKDGRWERSRLVGVEVKGKTLGVIGLGKGRFSVQDAELRVCTDNCSWHNCRQVCNWSRHACQCSGPIRRPCYCSSSTCRSRVVSSRTPRCLGLLDHTHASDCQHQRHDWEERASGHEERSSDPECGSGRHDRRRSFVRITHQWAYRRCWNGRLHERTSSSRVVSGQSNRSPQGGSYPSSRGLNSRSSGKRQHRSLRTSPLHPPRRPPS